MCLLRLPQLLEEKTKICCLHLVFYSFTAGATNAGYVIGAGVVMRKLCKQRDANLDPMSLVFPTIGNLTFQANLSKSHLFSVTWFGLNTCSSLQEDDFNGEKLVCSFCVSFFF